MSDQREIDRVAEAVHRPLLYSIKWYRQQRTRLMGDPIARLLKSTRQRSEPSMEFCPSDEKLDAEDDVVEQDDNHDYINRDTDVITNGQSIHIVDLLHSDEWRDHIDFCYSTTLPKSPTTGLISELKWWQVTGKERLIRFAQSMFGGVLFCDKRGLGKTLTEITPRVRAMTDIIEMIRGRLPGEKILVMSSSVMFLDIIGKALKRLKRLDNKPLMRFKLYEYNGTMKPWDRSDTVRYFDLLFR